MIVAFREIWNFQLHKITGGKTVNILILASDLPKQKSESQTIYFSFTHLLSESTGFVQCLFSGSCIG